MCVADIPAVTHIEGLSSPAPWAGDLFHGCLRPDYLCRVMEREGTVIAFAVANQAAGEGHLLNIAVHPAWRGQGHGRRFLGTMLSLMRRCGANVVFLEVRRSNDRAIGLYRKFGFEVIGIRQDYYVRDEGREDALTMRAPVVRDTGGD